MTGDGSAGQIVVRGGPGGTVARLEDLDRAGAQLQAAARVMASVAVRAAGVAADPAVVATASLSPVTWIAAQRTLARAVGPPSGAVVVAARLTGLGTAARGTSTLYRTADAAAAAGLHVVDVAVGRAVGALVTVPAVASVFAMPVVPVGAVEIVALSGLALDRVGRPGADGGLLVGRPEVATTLLGLLGAHPGCVEHAVAALPGVLDGVTGVLGGVPGLETATGLVLLGTTGVPAVPPDVPGAARWLGRLTSSGPWLREGGTVSVVGRRQVVARPPTGLADVIGGVASLDPAHGTAPGTVRVVAVAGPDGRRAWIAQVPGTQDWSLRAGRNPLDLTGNVHGMAAEPTAGRRLVEVALRSAGARPGEPVLLAGHSQGGLVAAQLAADPAFRASFTVTHVVTAGAPVGSARVPDSVAVLSLEHDEDLVPRLDGRPNPDRPGWVTVSRSTATTGGPPGALIAHDLSAYTRTAASVDAAADPGLVRWRSGLRPFLAGPGVTATGLEVTGVRGL